MGKEALIPERPNSEIHHHSFKEAPFFSFPELPSSSQVFQS
jgi:hypothetical protein